MADDKNQHRDALLENSIVKCPACVQAYFIAGMSRQVDSEMACSQCNAIFRLEIQKGKFMAQLLTPATGVQPGPAEGPRRERG